MCTLTWLFNGDSYAVLFNRDELKTRKRAIPPEHKQSTTGVSYIAPTDTDAGGTWLAVNQYGITVCLLNDYLAPEPVRQKIQSRGEVVTSLADSTSIVDLEYKLNALDLSPYKGFELVVFHNDVWHWRWDTQNLSKVDAIMPITSSSYEPEGVQKVRRKYFSRLENTNRLSTLEHFHSCHLDSEMHEIDGEPIAVSSVCMHRSYAQTVSQCFVQVNSSTISVRYTDGPPCQCSAGKPVVLNRLAVA